MRISPVKDNVWKLVRHFGADDDAGCLRRLLPAERVPSQERVDAIIAELAESPELLAAVDCAASRTFVAKPQDARERLDRQLELDGAGRGRAVLLYVTARLLRPEVIVETGCFTGWDSAVLLQALQRNAAGHLYSIDLPAHEGMFSQHGSYSSLPEGLQQGFLVPDTFRERWTLIEGDVRSELMPLLERIGPVGMFLHDSDHSYPHMMWEYTAILPHMIAGGVVASDDIAWNTSFWDFASAVGRRCVIHRSNPNVGAIAVPGGRHA